MSLLKQGTKYALTALFLALSGGLMVASYVLALADKLTGDWVTLCTVILPSWAFATVGYQTTRAFTDGKIITHGSPSPTPIVGTEPSIWRDDER